MRPAGDVRQAILAAARELATDDRGGTMAEIVQRACVGKDVGRRTVENLVRAGALHKPRTRKVSYRNKPVAEYAPPPEVQPAGEVVDVGSIFGMWVQR